VGCKTLTLRQSFLFQDLKKLFSTVFIFRTDDIVPSLKNCHSYKITSMENKFELGLLLGEFS